jgi:hypothetical protein
MYVVKALVRNRFGSLIYRYVTPVSESLDEYIDDISSDPPKRWLLGELQVNYDTPRHPIAPRYPGIVLLGFLFMCCSDWPIHALRLVHAIMWQFKA